MKFPQAQAVCMTLC